MWLKRSMVTLKIMRPAASRAAYELAYEASTIIYSKIYSKPGSEIVSWRELMEGGIPLVTSISLLWWWVVKNTRRVGPEYRPEYA